MRKVLIIGGAAVAAWYLFLGGKSVFNLTRLNFLLGKVGIQFDGITPIAVLDIYAQNPTGSTYDLSAISGQLYFNGTNIGNIAYFNPLTIAAVSQTKIIVPVRLSLIGAATQLLPILTGGLKIPQAVMRVVGTVNVNSIPAPIDLSFSII